jgi:hypothetical protein
MIRKNANFFLRRGWVARLLSIPSMDKGHEAAYQNHVLISIFIKGYILLD